MVRKNIKQKIKYALAIALCLALVTSTTSPSQEFGGSIMKSAAIYCGLMNEPTTGEIFRDYMVAVFLPGPPTNSEMFYAQINVACAHAVDYAPNTTEGQSALMMMVALIAFVVFVKKASIRKWLWRREFVYFQGRRPFTRSQAQQRS